MVFYNEINPFAAAWLRELIKANLIAPGIVDERSVKDITPNELEQYKQCHFFAGIGGWSYALRLAGWPDDRPVWTGSCPCQPFSTAGRRKGFADERHLWPAFYWLIQECHPPIVFGEQVAGKAGREWLSVVRDDLENTGYAFGASDLCACSVGAKFIRQRHYWVGMGDAHFNEHRRANGPISRGTYPHTSERTPTEAEQAWNRGESELVANGTLQRISSYSDALRALDGIPYHMEQVFGFGNAIVPQVAEKFIRAVMEVA